MVGRKDSSAAPAGPKPGWRAVDRGRHEFLWQRRRAPLDLTTNTDTGLSVNTAPLDLTTDIDLAGPLVVPPLQQHVADAGLAWGGGVGRVKSVVVCVVTGWAPIDQ
jgi:hypothetical protein